MPTYNIPMLFFFASFSTKSLTLLTSF